MGETIKIKTHVDRLQFRFPFHIAHGTRTGTDVVFVLVELNGHVGIGEATLPPYLGETIESSLHFFNTPEVKDITWPFHPAEIFHRINDRVAGHMPAKAALDMALWRVYASITQTDIGKELGIIPNGERVPHCYTIDVSNTEILKEKYEFAIANGFSFFKLKLDGVADERMINDFRNISEFPFAVDANQAWEDIDSALLRAEMLKEFGCTFIEQPFHKSDIVNTKKLVQLSGLTIMADEALQLASDFDRIAEGFNAINLKLQKCGGLTPAMDLLSKAKSMDMPVMVGCMSESSVGCDAGEIIAPTCKWADLDGPYLITNNDELLNKLEKLKPN